MDRRTWSIAAALLLGVGLVVVRGRAHGQAAAQPLSHMSQKQAARARSPSRLLSNARSPVPPALLEEFYQQEDWAPSLQGTEPDGGIDVTADGSLLVTVGLRRLFDYYLSTSDEASEALIAAHIEQAIRATTSEPAASQAVTLLHTYLRWRHDTAVALEADGAADGNMTSIHARLKQMRRATFDAATVEAFWGDEERDVDAVLTRSVRPDATQRSEAAAVAVLNAMTTQETWHQYGASPSALQNLRTWQFGADAAERLAALDVARDTWRRRVQEYLQARAHILADTNLQEAQRYTAVDALRAARFVGAERLRVQTFEQ